MKPYDKDEAARLVETFRDLADDGLALTSHRAMADQLEAAMAEIERLRADLSREVAGRETCERGRVDDAAEIDALEAERDVMRPVVEAAVRVAELDELLDQHPSNDDSVGQQAEIDLYHAVRDRTRAVDEYRARKS